MEEIAFSRVILKCAGRARRAASIVLVCLIAVSCGYAQPTDTAEQHYTRGAALDKNGDQSGAIAEFQAALQLDPNFVEALNDLARIYATAKDATLRDPLKALKYALQAVALDNGKNPTHLDTLAKAYDVNGDEEDAVLTERKALALLPDDSSGHPFEVRLERYEVAALPADTATFISYCANHFDACRIAVLDVDNYTLIGELGGAHGCTYPNSGGRGLEAVRADSAAATKAILAWLKENGAPVEPKRDDAIEHAMAALWPSGCVH